MKPSSAKNKGREHQKFIVALLLEELAEFGIEEDDITSRSMGSGGVDCLLSPLAQKIFPVSIEAKATRKFPTAAILKQARANAYKGTAPAIVWKPHGARKEDTMIAFNLKEFVLLVKKLVKEQYNAK